MPDVLTPEQRKRNMKNIKAKDTKIEVILRRALWNKGYRYRKNYKAYPDRQTLFLQNIKSQYFAMENFFMAKTGKN
jgi:DNA mismatch endonuclease (patch repair protein)